MTVPCDDWLCRFVPDDAEGKWNRKTNKPTFEAFKANDKVLSLYHHERVKDLDSTLAQVCDGQFKYDGQAHLRAQDYLDAVKDFKEVDVRRYPKNERKPALQFEIVLEWNPENVTERCERWKDAHVDARAGNMTGKWPADYRKQLLRRCTWYLPPRAEPGTQRANEDQRGGGDDLNT